MKLSSIPFLRAIAVILIVYTHAVLTIQELAGTSLPREYNLRNAGFIGFDLLFVIAGFMTGLAYHQYKSFGTHR